MILLGTPRELNIPYFAIGDPASRENGVTRLGLDSELRKLVGRRSLAWIDARKNQAKITFVETRNYVPLKTAFYAEWLVFETEAMCAEFVQTFPIYCLNIRLAKINGEREALATDLDRRRKRGDFDLSRVGAEQQRADLARQYVEKTDKLHQLQDDLRLLKTAKQFRDEWQEKL
jgi:hypothetical protein